MGTQCRLIFGYYNYSNEWVSEKEYFRFYDGSPEMIKPLLEKYGEDIIGYLDENAEYDSWKFEDVTNNKNTPNGEYIYYFNTYEPDYGKCTILAFDWDFFVKYKMDSYYVLWEGVL